MIYPCGRTRSSVQPGVMRNYERMRSGFKKRADTVTEPPEVG